MNERHIEAELTAMRAELQHNRAQLAAMRLALRALMSCQPQLGHVDDFLRQAAKVPSPDLYLQEQIQQILADLAGSMRPPDPMPGD